MTIIRLRNAPFRRAVSAITLAAFTLTLTDCASYRWSTVPVQNVSLDKERITGRDIRVGSKGGFVELSVATLAFPYVTGRAKGGHGVVQFNMGSADRAELVTLDTTGEVTKAKVIGLRVLTQTPDSLLSKSVRFTTSEGPVVLADINRVEFPWVEGRLGRSNGRIRVDLRSATSIAVTELNGGRTVLKTVGLIAAVVAVAAVIVALTKQSCPFVYVDRGSGWEFVGEAYSGAAFRATQRDDLLPLPDIHADSGVRIRLRNEARETQYTDRAELVIVDHAPDVRALSTFDGLPVLVGAQRPPVSARDAMGNDVASLVAERDDRLWETTPDSLGSLNGKPLEDQLIAEFALPATGTPVLEVVGGNTMWLDLVFGRFFAAMGDRLSGYLARGNDPAARESIERWREREGVDLTVEMQADGAWKKVAVIPPVGPAALREVAVLLPVPRDSGMRNLKVRLRGGLGFWRIDRLGLSLQDDGTPEALHVRPRTAQTNDGRSDLAAVLETDGRYNALAEMNERLDMEFDLPPLGANRVRSAFLFTNGYYNVHPAVQARWLPATLRTIRDEPGALSRFSRDLAREYAKTLRALAASSGPMRNDR